MKILILGAGRTGASVAQALAGEENDIVVIDYNVQLLEALKEHVKTITTVVGNAAHPDVLEQADAQNADLVIAVTDRDETNMLACTVINKLYSRPKTIARIRAIDYLKNPQLLQFRTEYPRRNVLPVFSGPPSFQVRLPHQDSQGNYQLQWLL